MIRMHRILHITSGDIAGEILEKSDVPGEVFVWRDILYDGSREPGWPDEETILARAGFLEESTGGGLTRKFVFETLRTQHAVQGSGQKIGLRLRGLVCELRL